MVPSLCIGPGRNQRGLDRWLYEHEHGNVTSSSQVGGKHHKLFSDLCTNIDLNCIWALKVLSHINGKMKIQWFLGILDLLLVVLNLNLNHTSVIFNQMYRVSAYVHRYVRVWHHQQPFICRATVYHESHHICHTADYLPSSTYEKNEIHGDVIIALSNCRLTTCRSSDRRNEVIIL